MSKFTSGCLGFNLGVGFCHAAYGSFGMALACAGSAGLILLLTGFRRD